MVDLHRCVRSCDTVNDLSNIKHFSNTIKNLNLSVFNMIARTNESQTLIKHISYACKCKFHGRKCNSNQKWNNGKCQCRHKNRKEHYLCNKYYVWTSDTRSCGNGKYLASFIIIQVFAFILLVLLLITIALLIAVSTYCYLTKHQAKQKHLLPYHFTNNKLNKFFY